MMTIGFLILLCLVLWFVVFKKEDWNWDMESRRFKRENPEPKPESKPKPEMNDLPKNVAETIQQVTKTDGVNVVNVITQKQGSGGAIAIGCLVSAVVILLLLFFIGFLVSL